MIMVTLIGTIVLLLPMMMMVYLYGLLRNSLQQLFSLFDIVDLVSLEFDGVPSADNIFLEERLHRNGVVRSNG